MNKILEMIWNGQDICFTFKSEAKQFATRHGLTIEYNDGEINDNEHYIVKGYKGKLYWIAP